MLCWTVLLHTDSATEKHARGSYVACIPSIDMKTLEADASSLSGKQLEPTLGVLYSLHSEQPH